MTIAVLGAGAIGIAIGAPWGATLIGRDPVLAPIARDGLRLTGLGPDRDLAPDSFRVAGPDALAAADLIAVAAKFTALSSIVDAVTAHARPNTPILSLMNGLAPVRDLSAALPNPILRGMVPFNVVWRDATHLHRSSAGSVAVEVHPATEGLRDVDRRTDMEALQYGKLLLNLINPINALSGRPLHAMLSDRAWRRIYAATLAEALRVYDAAGIVFTKAGPVPPRLAPRLLRLPDAIFVRTLLRLQRLDATSVTSLATDLAQGRPTEIEALNGEIVRLAGGHAPINEGLVRLVRDAERGGRLHWSAPELVRELSL
ncbi:MAG: ketopantoate reductase C-terminal domain-containing protein [Pseudomonadota bacterium]